MGASGKAPPATARRPCGPILRRVDEPLVTPIGSVPPSHGTLALTRRLREIEVGIAMSTGRRWAIGRRRLGQRLLAVLAIAALTMGCVADTSSFTNPTRPDAVHAETPTQPSPAPADPAAPAPTPATDSAVRALRRPGPDASSVQHRCVGRRSRRTSRSSTTTGSRRCPRRSRTSRRRVVTGS